MPSTSTNRSGRLHKSIGTLRPVNFLQCLTLEETAIATGETRNVTMAVTALVTDLDPETTVPLVEEEEEEEVLVAKIQNYLSET